MQLFDLTLEAALGSGGMGTVWRGRTPSGQLVAVKVGSPAVADRPRLRRLVEGEIRAMARLDHPAALRLLDHGIVPVGVDLPEGAPYLVLEHCSGGTVAERPPATWEGLLSLVVALLGALGHAHARGIVHRDLKPTNVLLASPEDGRPGPKLADFGIAHALGSGPSRIVVGTPSYMAPEQRTSQVDLHGPWTDLYALGALIDAVWRGSPEQPGVASFPAPPGFAEFVAALRTEDPRRRVRDVPTALRLLRAIEPELPPPPDPFAVRPSSIVRAPSARVAASRPSPFVGHEALRTAMLEALRIVVQTGRVGLVGVRGGSGLGKTRLLEWLGEHCTETGIAAVVRVRCGRGAEPLLELICALFELRDLSSEELRRAAMVGLASRGLPEAEREVLTRMLSDGDERWGAVPAVRALVRARARVHGGLVLLLDDVGECDPALTLIRALLVERSSDEAPVLIVATERGSTGALDRAAALVQAPLHRLEALPRPEAELLARATGLVDPGARRRLLEVSGTAPGDILAVSRGLAGGDDGDEHTLRTVSERGLVALERAAVMGPEVDEELWEQVDDRAGCDLFELRARVAALTAAFDGGLLEETEPGFRFTRAGVRVWLLERAERGGRLADHHLAVAETLEPVPRTAVARAEHLVRAGRPTAAVTVLLGALRLVTGRSPRELREVVEVLEDAVAAGGIQDPLVLAEVAIGRAAVLVEAGLFHEASGVSSRAVTFAEQSGDRTTLAAAHARRADTLIAAGRLDEVVPAIERFLEFDDVARLSPRVLQRGRLASLRRRAGDQPGAQRLEQEIESLAAGDPSLTVAMALLEARARSGPGSDGVLALASRVGQLARAEGHLTGQVFAATKRVEALVKREDWTGAHAELPAALALASLAERELSRWVLEVAQLQCLFGTHGAAAALEQAEALLDLEPPKVALGFLLLLRFRFAEALGDEARIRDSFARISSARADGVWFDPADLGGSSARSAELRDLLSTAPVPVLTPLTR